jgi:hypothetical protein
MQSIQTRDERGSVLVTAVIVTVLLGTAALTFMSVSARQQREGHASDGHMNAFYAAEAGLSAAVVAMRNGGDGNVGSATQPRALGGLSYWVEATVVDGETTALVASATDGSTNSRIELVVADTSAEINDFGLFGERMVDLKSNCLIDSFDSSAGTYLAQVSGGHAKENGNVGSNDDIQLASNSKVYGYAQYGPDLDDTVSVAANVTVSDGYGAAESHVVLAPVVAPSYASSGSLTVNAGQTKSIGPGNLQYTALTTKSNSHLKVVGPCTLVVTDAATINSNSTWTLDATNGAIQVYALNNFELKSNATVATTKKDPTQLSLYLAGQHTSLGDTTPKIDFSANSAFYGTIHAPDLSVTISSNFELFGSVKSEWLTVASNAKLHYDEVLANGVLDPGNGLDVVAWRELSGELAATE